MYVTEQPTKDFFIPYLNGPAEAEDLWSRFATAKITFHVATVPNHPVPHIHADLSISRFPLMPVTYVPARGDRPPGATVWLHAPEGFLRQHEPNTLLAAPAQYIWAREHRARQWQCKPGLATALSTLTQLPFPAPDKVFAHPSAAADEGKSAPMSCTARQ
jgi:hypothetical protein